MKKAVLCALAILLAGVSARAEQITYTESVIGSGSLNGVNFTNALVTLTGTGDTSGIVFLGAGSYDNDVTMEGTVQGLGTFTFTDETSFFVSDDNGAFGANDGLDILDTISPSFDTYDLASSIGPVTGTSLFNGTHFYGTTAGLFNLSSAGDPTVQTTTAATPEPGSLLLLGSGVLGMAGVVRRRLS